MKLISFSVKNYVSMFIVFFFNCSLIYYLYVCIFDMYFLKKKILNWIDFVILGVGFRVYSFSILMSEL